MNNPESLFSLYFTSRTRDEVSSEIAQKKLAQYFNFSPIKIQKLIEKASKSPVLIRENLKFEEAKKISDKILSCGFYCEVTPQNIDILSEEVPVGNPENFANLVIKYITCPKCHTEQPEDNKNCVACGFVVSKTYEKTNDVENVKANSQSSKIPTKELQEHSRILNEHNLVNVKSALPLFLLFFLLSEIPYTKHIVLYYTEVFVHEFAHTLTLWLFGHFVIPSFTFFGFGELDGVNLGSTEQNKSVLYVMYFIALYLLYRALPWPNIFTVFFIFTLVYFFISLSPLHEQFVFFIGYGSYSLVAGWFLFMALLGDVGEKSLLRTICMLFGLIFTYIALRFLWDFPINVNEIHSSNKDLESICRTLNISPQVLRIIYSGYTILVFTIFLSLYKSYDKWAGDFFDYRRSLSKFVLNN